MRTHAAGSEHGNLVEGGETRQADTSLFSRLLCLSSVFLTRSGRQGVVKGMAWSGDNCHERSARRHQEESTTLFEARVSIAVRRGFETNAKRTQGEACRTSCASYSGLSGSDFCLASPTRCVGPFDLDNSESRSVPSPRSARVSREHRWVFRRRRRLALNEALSGSHVRVDLPNLQECWLRASRMGFDVRRPEARDGANAGATQSAIAQNRFARA